MKTISTTEIKTWGNSLGVRIPKKVVDALKLHDGSQVKISLDGNKVVLESENNPFFDLSQDLNLMTLLSKITSKNKHSSDEDEAVGQEVW
jgi:antitoxin component of MazEF toxin-antitoxin module